jgi:hypothetical protein
VQPYAIDNYNGASGIETDGLKRLLRKERNAYNSVIKAAKVVALSNNRYCHTLTDKQTVAGKYIGQANVIIINVNI